MKRPGKGSWIPFMSLLLLVLGSSIILWAIGNTAGLDSWAAVLAPLIAGVAGFYGMAHFAPRGFVREDRFHVMFILLGVGLFVMLVAEIAGIAIETADAGSSMVFTVGFIQILGMFAFSLGIIGYFVAVNNTMGYLKPVYLWLVVLLVPIVMVVLLTTLSYDPIRSLMLPELVTSGIVAIGFGASALSLAITAWVFRRGRILIPIAFILLSVILLFFRGVAWTAYAITPVLTFSRLLGISAYVMMAGAINAVRVNEC
ncbi:MAG: hypothetical protein ACW99U_14805 [Candidatus Thorarchaeota archaeon]|jgi:hypothetical protein